VTALTATQFFDVGALPVSGNPYRVEVKDNNENETGSYRIHLQRLTAAAVCDSATLICGRAIRDSIQDRTDSDLKRFQVADLATITVHTEVRWKPRANFNPVWRIIRGDGTALTGFNVFGVTNVNNMPASGNPYSIEIKDNVQDDIGAYSLEIRTSECTTVSVDPGSPAPKTVELRIFSPEILGRVSSVRLSFANPKPGPVSLQVFNPLGQRVATLVKEDTPAGWHEIDWDTGSVASGVYFVRLEASGVARQRKFAFVK
jgi:hypothetical protein